MKAINAIHIFFILIKSFNKPVCHFDGGSDDQVHHFMQGPIVCLALVAFVTQTETMTHIVVLVQKFIS